MVAPFIDVPRPLLLKIQEALGPLLDVICPTARRVEAARPRRREAEAWGSAGQVVAGGKYFYTRNQSTLVAFVVGGAYDNDGFFTGVAIMGPTPSTRVP